MLNAKPVAQVCRETGCNEKAICDRCSRCYGHCECSDATKPDDHLLNELASMHIMRAAKYYGGFRNRKRGASVKRSQVRVITDEKGGKRIFYSKPSGMIKVIERTSQIETQCLLISPGANKFGILSEFENSIFHGIAELTRLKKIEIGPGKPAGDVPYLLVDTPLPALDYGECGASLSKCSSNLLLRHVLGDDNKVATEEWSVGYFKRDGYTEQEIVERLTEVTALNYRPKKAKEAFVKWTIYRAQAESMCAVVAVDEKVDAEKIAIHRDTFAKGDHIGFVGEDPLHLYLKQPTRTKEGWLTFDKKELRGVGTLVGVAPVNCWHYYDDLKASLKLMSMLKEKSLTGASERMGITVGNLVYLISQKYSVAEELGLTACYLPYQESERSTVHLPMVTFGDLKEAFVVGSEYRTVQGDRVAITVKHGVGHMHLSENGTIAAELRNETLVGGLSLEEQLRW